MRFTAALLASLVSFVAGPNAALPAAPQHHDQAPGFYRVKVGDLEVTALFDGTGVFDPHWLNGTTATMDGVLKALHEDPHVLDVADTGFLVNTGRQLILVDVGAGTWWGGGAFGRLAGSLRSAGYTPEEVNIVLVTHLHSDHVGGLTTQDGKRIFPHADVYVAKAESDFWLSPDIAAKAPKDAQPFFQSAQAIAAPYIKAGKWHPFSGSEKIVDGMELVPCLVIPRDIPAMNFRRRDKKSCFGATSSMHLHRTSSKAAGHNNRSSLGPSETNPDRSIYGAACLFSSDQSLTHCLSIRICGQPVRCVHQGVHLPRRSVLD
jgi:hypothetical protein